MVLESGKMKLGVAIAILTGATVGGLYWAYKQEQSNLPEETETKEQMQDSSVIQMAKPVPVTPKAQEAEKTEPETKEVKPASPAKEKGLAEKIQDQLAGKGPSYESLVEKVKARLQMEQGNPVISMQAIILCHDALVEHAHKEFGTLTIDNRTQRRLHKDTDLQMYENIVMSCTGALELMMNENLTKVLSDCGITQQVYEQSNQYWAQMNPQFAMISLMVVDKMKLMIPSTKVEGSISIKDVIAVIDYQTETYPTLSNIECSNRDAKAMVKQSILNDMVFEKFGFEEEDYIRVKGLEQNRDFAMKAQNLQMMVQMDSFGGMGGMGQEQGMMMPGF